MKLGILLFVEAVLGLLAAQGQGAFQNLDFEATTISQTQSFGAVNVSDALPGWTVFYGASGPQAQMDFNALILSLNPLPWVVLNGTNGLGMASIEGGFSVLLTGREVATPGEADAPAGSITQTGLVPADAQSIFFKAQPGDASFVVSLDNQSIPFIALVTGLNYTLYGGNISAFAGQTSELSFVAGIYGTAWNLDSIEFSSQPVPEPSTLALLIAGIGLFFFYRQRCVA